MASCPQGLSLANSLPQASNNRWCSLRQLSCPSVRAMFISEASLLLWQHSLTICVITGKETQKHSVYICLTDHGWQGSCLCISTYVLSSLWWPSQVYVKQEQLLFTDSTCHRQLEEMSAPWIKNNGELALIINLTYSPLDNFWKILGLHSPVIGQEILCVFWHAAITTPERQRKVLCFVPSKRSCI